MPQICFVDLFFHKCLYFTICSLIDILTSVPCCGEDGTCSLRHGKGSRVVALQHILFLFLRASLQVLASLRSG